MLPDLPAHHRQRIAEGRLGLVVPGRVPPWQLAAFGVLGAISVTSQDSASKAGVVRRIAKSDYGRWVSTPKCSRTSCRVTSNCQRNTNYLMIGTSATVSSVETGPGS